MVWEDSATISKAMSASSQVPFKRTELLDKFYIKTRHTQSIIFVWCKVSWKYIKLTVRECLAWLPRSSAFHYLFNYNQIERLLKKKKITVVLKEAWHTNDFIASQVENAVIFYFFGINLFSFSNVVINPECVFCRLSLLSYSLLSLEEVFPIQFSIIGTNLYFLLF